MRYASLSLNRRPARLVSANAHGQALLRGWMVAWLMLLAVGASLVPESLGQLVPPGIPAQIVSEAVREAARENARLKKDEPSAEGTDEAREPTKKIADTGVEMFYVRDESGELVPVLNLSYTDFVRLYQIDRGLNAAKQPPLYTIEDMSLSGHSQGDKADLSIAIQIRVLSDQITRIPLQLNGAILRQPARYEGEGEHVLAASGENGSYVSWVQGAAQSVHKVFLDVLVPVTRVGSESRLKLSLPSSNASSLVLEIPEKRISATVSSAARVMDTRSIEDGKTQITVAGLRGEFELGWTSVEALEETQLPLLMEAAGFLEVLVKGPGSVSTRARVRVSSTGRRMEVIQIRLPAGSRPIAVDSPRYTMEFVMPTGPSGSPEHNARENNAGQTLRPLAIARLTEPTMGPVDIELVVEQTGSGVFDTTAAAVPGDSAGDSADGDAEDPDADRSRDAIRSDEVVDEESRTTSVADTASSSDASPSDRSAESRQSMDVLGFEVVDALRQFGTVSLNANDEWFVRTEPSSALRRLAEIPESMARDGLVAAFEYYRQPASLHIKVLPKQTRVNIEPAYVFDIQQDLVELTAILDCRVLGAPAFSLHVDMEGWDIQEVGQPNLIQEDNLRLSEVSPLEIPFASAMRGDFQIRIKARRPVKPGAKNLALRLPRVRGASVSAATVVVSPADNLELKEDLATMKRFDPESVPEGLALPQRARSPMCYRYRGDSASATLAYDLGLRKQSVSVAVASEVSIERLRTVVHQQFDYDVLYQPLDRVVLQVPKRLVEDDTFALTLDGDVIAEENISRLERSQDEDEDHQGDEYTDELWEVRLRPQRIGAFSLGVGYELEWSLEDVIAGVQTPPFDASLPNTIPLVRPGEQLAVNASHLSIRCPRQYTARISEFDDSWAVPSAVDTPSDLYTAVDYHAAIAPESVALAIRAVEPGGQMDSVVDRLYVQTWLTVRERQDRIAAVVSGAVSPMRIRFPGTAILGDRPVLINGEPVAARREGINGLIVEIPNATNGRVDGETRIEFSFRYARRPGVGEMRLELPRIQDALWVRRFYWQLVTPENELLISHGDQVASEQQWHRRGMIWFRRPTIDQSHLEAMLGATRQVTPSTSTNQYLFSGFGESPVLHLHTATRRWVLLVASGTALMLALLVQSMRWLTSRWILVPLAMTIVSMAWLYPEPTVVLTQAAVIGVGVFMGTRILAWLRRDRTLRPPSALAQTGSRVSLSASFSRGSSITAPHSTDELSIPATTQN